LRVHVWLCFNANTFILSKLSINGNLLFIGNVCVSAVYRET